MAAKVFLCYRRDETAGYAGRVQDRLAQEFGRDLLFMDVDTVPLGVNFVTVLHNQVAKCEVLLAVIGPNWLDARDEDGTRRLDDPKDFVRIEIGAALQRDIPVIPILLDGAKVPKANQLPKDLEELSLRNGLDVRHASFHNDMDRLIRGLKGQLEAADAGKRRAVEDELGCQEAENKRRLDKAVAEQIQRSIEQERRLDKERVYTVVPEPGTVSAVRIKEENGETRLFRVEVGSTYKIGRANDMDIVLSDTDKTVSRQHAKMIVHANYVEVMDQGSLNKIELENDPVQRTYVKVGLHQSFFLGGAQFVVVP